jgi:aryl sulfotransferase
VRRYRSIVADSARWEGFQFRPDDIVISTPPKCGTTWMQTLCALLVFETVDLGRPLAEISPWLDMQVADRDKVFALLASQEHRRIIKTHTPLDGVPFHERVTYLVVGRDPRDVAVSSAHHMQNLNRDRFLELREQAVGLDDLAELVQAQPGPPPSAGLTPLQAWIVGDDDTVPMCLAYLTNHLGVAWQRRELPNVTLFHYDDLLADLPGQMCRLRDVLGAPADDALVRSLAAAASFGAMKQRAHDFAPNADVGMWHDHSAFFHAGQSGQWRDAFDLTTLRRYEARIAELVPPELASWLHNGTTEPAAVTSG